MQSEKILHIPYGYFITGGHKNRRKPVFTGYSQLIHSVGRIPRYRTFPSDLFVKHGFGE